MSHATSQRAPGRRRMLVTSCLAVALVAFVASPVAGAVRSRDVPVRATFDQADTAASVEYVGGVKLTPTRGVAGTEVAVDGTGFEPGWDLEIVWHSVAGQWVLQGEAQEEFHGRAFEPTATQVTGATVAGDGTFRATFVAPVDFGFNHDVTVELEGTLLNKAGFRLEPRLIVEPASGAVGTPIRVRFEGVGWANLENSWQLTYDNRFTGVLTSVTTGGVAEAVITATGEPGPHRIRVVHGAFTVPYLNGQQSPRPDRDDYVFDFEVTPGDPVLPVPAARQGLPVAETSAPDGTDAALWADVASGPVGTPIAFSGRDLPSGAVVQLRWTTVVGNRVSGSGWEEVALDVGHTVVADDGTLEWAWAIPDDLGGPHRLIALVDGAPVAETSVTITPSLVSAEVIRGSFGDEAEIRIKGVGWTETANIYHLVYDNGYLGYACGFNSQGDVTIRLPLTGTNGWHFVDLYPGIYKGQDAGGVQNFRTPQLTYEADHPGEDLPAFRIALALDPDPLTAAAEAEAAIGSR